MKIKVCGMSRAANIADIAALEPDYMGFIFYPPSPRFCRDWISSTVIASLPERIMPVAVTVDMKEDEILALAEEYGFKTFQLHGSESPELCRRLREMGMVVIKAFGINGGKDFERMASYSGNVDYFLFDTATARKGGSGRKFDWILLSNYIHPEPFLLSGGIGPEDLEDLKEMSHPCFYGIDLNSRFETSPGIKDVGLLENFITQIKNNYE